MNRQTGFTLLELAVVVLLIALFTGLSIPLLGRLGVSGLDNSARRLAGTVKYLFNEAALSGRPYRLTYDLSKGSYRAARLETDGELTIEQGLVREQRLKGSVRFRDLSVSGRGSFSSGEVSIDILPVGWMEETTIHLDDGADQVLTLRINPFTGATEMYQGYREF
ncbi:prepilin-type N-terminal cleavage/methylation domain-containing protein [Trichloromonas sp.]|uniref:prepilin-type N-terminal cleavage/methylation domain-containing protein n=1 Tax=Trichloromonas sp. TaxID=3069249 RepID=UPI003D8138A0